MDFEELLEQYETAHAQLGDLVKTKDALDKKTYRLKSFVALHKIMALEQILTRHLCDARPCI